MYLDITKNVESSLGILDAQVNFLRATNLVIDSGNGAGSFCLPLLGNPLKVSPWFPIKDIKYFLDGMNRAKARTLGFEDAYVIAKGGDPANPGDPNEPYEPVYTPSGMKITFADSTLNSEFKKAVALAHTP
jgi:hypothetical protein